MSRFAPVMLTVLGLTAMPLGQSVFAASSSVSTVSSQAATAPASSTSATDLTTAYNAQTDLDFRKGLQIRLAWSGDYVGAFDGDVNAVTLRAVRDFQARHGMTADGVISEPMLKSLIAVSDEVETRFGLSLRSDTDTGATAAIPTKLVSDLGRSDVGHLWRSADNTLEIETVRIADTGQTLSGLYQVLSTPTADRSVANAQFGGDWFTIDGIEAGRPYTMKFDGRGGDLRGFSVSYAADQANRVLPYVVVAQNLFDPYAGEPDAPLVAANDPKAFSTLLARKRGGDENQRYAMAYADPANPHRFEMPDDQLRGATPSPVPYADDFDMAGSGFVVSKDGWLLTNAHVVKACKSVVVGDGNIATQTVFDPDHDLALVKVSTKQAGALGKPLAISAGKPRLGEDILALGYPLRSILADSLNVTRGNVSSLLGLMNDPRYLQISAPVQPGNSGGPLVDLAGRVVGVVTAKLNAVAVADATGDIPQSINFAIRPDAVTQFLHANKVAFTVADADTALESVPNATAMVKDSILPILCIGN